ncbi:MAG: thiamine-phosphate kinase [Bacteroidales bacterium]|nr:thiamine-phosphate kinase [Bacteroidales bacterium]
MIENKQHRTELAELGEFGLIDYLTSAIKIKNKTTVKGVGDDAAVLNFDTRDTLVTSDLLLEGSHFDLTYSPLKHIGYKAVIVNLSDILAMNGIPQQIVVSIGVSNRFSVEAIEEIYKGIYLACTNYDVDLVGGDTVSSNSGLVLSITAIGYVSRKDLVFRNTAKKGDLICVTGDLGAAYMGLMVLEREKQVFKADPKMQPELQGHDYILGRQLKPELRTEVLRKLKELKVKPTAMIDISDGLASEVLHICKQSKLGCNIYEDKIPVDTATAIVAREFSIDPSTCALHGGEDYELLFTIRQKNYELIKDLSEISVIGHMTEESSGTNMITRSNTQVPLTAQGWDAFLKRERSVVRKKK